MSSAEQLGVKFGDLWSSDVWEKVGFWLMFLCIVAVSWAFIWLHYQNQEQEDPQNNNVGVYVAYAIGAAGGAFVLMWLIRWVSRFDKAYRRRIALKTCQGFGIPSEDIPMCLQNQLLPRERRTRSPIVSSSDMSWILNLMTN